MLYKIWTSNSYKKNVPMYSIDSIECIDRQIPSYVIQYIQ